MPPAVEEEERAAIFVGQGGGDALVLPPSAAAVQELNGYVCNSGLDPFSDDGDVKPVLLSCTNGDAVLATPSTRRKRRKTASPSPYPGTVAEAAATVEERKPLALAFEDSRRMFQKLWTDADEITILQGFWEFTSARGTTHSDYQHDTGPFYDQIKGRLRLDFSKSQIVEKLRRLKKKYRNMAARMAGDKAFVFRSHHDQATFEIASKIWNPTFKRSKTSPQDDEDDDEYVADHEIVTPVIRYNLLAATAAQDGGGALSSEDTANSSMPAESVEVAAGETGMFPVSNNTVPPTAPIIGVTMFSAAPPEKVAGVAHPLSKKVAARETEAPLSSDPNLAIVEEMARRSFVPLFNELLHHHPMSNGALKHLPALEEQWKQQHILELEAYLKRVELVHEHIKLKLEELRSQDSSSSN